MQFKPYDYQKYAIDRVVNQNNVGVFLDMGLGKTIITLSAIKELKFNRFSINKVLIIAPKKVAEATWQKEIKKWDHLNNMRVSTILGTPKKRIKALYAAADIYIINRDNVTWLVDYLKNDWFFDMVVIDEFSSFKNHKSKRFKSLAAIKPLVNRIIGLTGTPSPNGLGDLWAQVFLLDAGERLGKTYGGFRQRYFNEGAKNGYIVYNYTPKEGARPAILEKIDDICVSMKAKDYLELPDVIDNDVYIELDDKARKKYDEMAKEMVTMVDEDQVIDAVSAAALSNKLLQLANGAVYDDEHLAHQVHDNKLEAFMEVVEKLNGEHVLVFYNFKHDLARIQKALEKTKLRVRLLKTAQDQDDWNDGNIDVLLTHPASSAYGLNLQDGGHNIIWFGLNWNYELYSQANKRLHRQGQKKNVTVTRLIISDSRDEDVVEALEHKDDTQRYVLESLKTRIREIKK